MCGIIGVAGAEQVSPRLIRGLKRLEYRGYDSSGIAVSGDRGITCFKEAGAVDVLTRSLYGKEPEGQAGIGHTRWATHGKPTRENAHPHLSYDGKFALVHNGIIENYRELKKLLPEGIRLLSQTDTEIVAHLLAHWYEGDVVKAMSRVCGEIKGSYAFALLCEDLPEKVFAAAKDSPLTVADCRGGVCVSSDLSAVTDEINFVFSLSGGEMCELDKRSVTFYDSKGQSITKEAEKIDREDVECDKGHFDSFMLKEIYEQPEAVRETVDSFLSEGKIRFGDVNINEGYIADYLERIELVGCGSAYHAALAGKNIIERLSGIPCNVSVASEFRYSECFVDSNTLCIFVSQSGETADTLAALRLCKCRGAKILSVVNVRGCTMARESENIIYTKAGKEVSVATTKAYSAQLAVLYALSIYFGEINGFLEENKARIMKNELSRLWEKIREGIEISEDSAKKLSSLLGEKDTVFFMGRLQDFATASEGSLKLKEVSYINSQAIASGELKHGTISLIDEGVSVFAPVSDNEVFCKSLGNIREVSARGGQVYAIVCEGTPSLGEVKSVITLPYVPSEYSPSLFVLPLQLISCYTAHSLGRDIDKPKNLAKSVTVE